MQVPKYVAMVFCNVDVDRYILKYILLIISL